TKSALTAGSRGSARAALRRAVAAQARKRAMSNILISTDQYHTDATHGYDFAASGDAVTIAAGILVGSGQDIAVTMSNTYSGDSLINNGFIFSGELEAVDLEADGSITNNIR